MTDSNDTDSQENLPVDTTPQPVQTAVPTEEPVHKPVIPASLESQGT